MKVLGSIVTVETGIRFKGGRKMAKRTVDALKRQEKALEKRIKSLRKKEKSLERRITKKTGKKYT